MFAKFTTTMSARRKHPQSQREELASTALQTLLSKRSVARQSLAREYGAYKQWIEVTNHNTAATRSGAQTKQEAGEKLFETEYFI